MVSVVNRFSEVTDESDDYEESNGMQMGKMPENLISIDTSDEFDESSSDQRNEEVLQSYSSLYPSLHKNGNIYRTEEEFQVEINRLKNQSSDRFKSKWDEILEKYAKVDDEKESDELDLVSGKIIKDNGHLRSLRTNIKTNADARFDGDIWSATYDLERDIHNKKVKESRLKQKKRELKRQLKDQKLFHNDSLQSSPLKADDFTHGSSFALSSEDNLLSLNPSPTKKFKVSPIKNSRGSSPVLDDDVSLLTPTKRRIGKFSNIYNEKSYPQKLHFDDIPHLHKNDSNKSGGLENIYDEKTSKPFLFYHNKMHGNTRSCETSSPQNYDGDTSNTATASDCRGYIETSETSDVESDDSKVATLCVSEQNDESITNQYFSQNDSNNGDYSLDFEDEYLIVNDPCIYTLTEISNKIYNCAIEYCHYCTGNKSLYQNHLLDKHSVLLHSIGYPVRDGTRILNFKIPQNIVSKLTKHFPLVFEVPRLPLSKNSLPFICGMNLGNSKTCQRFFITKHDLISHQRNAPNECSYKKQVLICPMLGCGYMTDLGYLEWRSHFIEKQHHVDPEHKNNTYVSFNSEDEEDNDESNLSQLSYIPNPNDKKEEYDTPIYFNNLQMNSLILTDKDQSKASTILDVVNEINDIFSDSGSDASINEYLEDDEDMKPNETGEDEENDAQLYHDEVPNLKIQSNLQDLPSPLEEDLQTGHESIEELFDD